MREICTDHARITNENSPKNVSGEDKRKLEMDFFTGGSNVTDYKVVFWLEATL